MTLILFFLPVIIKSQIWSEFLKAAEAAHRPLVADRGFASDEPLNDDTNLNYLYILMEIFNQQLQEFLHSHSWEGSLYK